jgi:hypothetical protein
MLTRNLLSLPGLSSEAKVRVLHLLAGLCAFAAAASIGYGAAGPAALFGGMTGFIAGSLRALAIVERIMGSGKESA